ncbi:MAG: cell division protein ZapA [Deltaproteobacteria bacterium]|nr:cell division protein ZapA [Deltaproteobacteria bacterium]
MKSHTVEIAGQKYSIRSDATEAHMRRVADLVNARVKAVRGAWPAAPAAQALALAALQLADEFCELEDHVVRERRETAAELRRVVGSLAEGAAAAEHWVAAAGEGPESTHAGPER